MKSIMSVLLSLATFIYALPLVAPSLAAIQPTPAHADSGSPVASKASEPVSQLPTPLPNATATPPVITAANVDPLPIVNSIITGTAAIASIGTLLFLYVQIRELRRQTDNLERNIRASTYQALLDSEREMWDRLAEEPGFLEAYLSSIKAKVPEVSAQYVRSVSVIIAFAENVFFQYQSGAIPPSWWPAWERLFADQFRGDLVRPVWEAEKHWFNEEFVTTIERLIEGTLHVSDDRTRVTQREASTVTESSVKEA